MARRKTFENAWDLVQQKTADECWPWLGCKNSTGYGSMMVSQKAYSAHRIIFSLVNPGLITYEAPKNKQAKEFILHKCDNRECCNPAHMTLGNYADNIQDAKQKGRTRTVRGAAHKKAKLTAEQAQAIRAMHNSNTTYVELGKMFNIHANNVSRIVRNKAYLEQRA